jgi:hypothetical protein
MCPAFLVVSLLVAGEGTPQQVRVYRFVDRQGTEHYVDQLDEVPPGVEARPVDLTEIPLNSETAKALEGVAKRADKAKPPPVPVSGAQPPPEDARLFLMWSAALTFAFLGLALASRAAKRTFPQLASAFGVVRFAAGSLALMSWGATAYEYRNSQHWIVEHFPPLQALERAVRTKQQVERQQKQMEHEIDQQLHGQ